MASTKMDGDGAEDVNDFLQRIRELGEKRNKEDEERTKKLEQEILQGRKERQARRMERARSISPQKDSPTPDFTQVTTPPANQQVIDPPENLEPTVQASDAESYNKLESSQDEERPVTDSPRPDSRAGKTDMESSFGSRPTSARSRSGTLSWQQRPTSRDLNSRSFMSASPTRESRWKSVSNASDDDGRAERDQIAASLSPKNSPSLRQSVDRGADVPDLRKISEEVPTEAGSSFNPFDTSQRSSGLNREYSAEPEKPINSMDGAEGRPLSSSGASSTVGDSTLSHRYSGISSATTATGLGSPAPLSSPQKFEPKKAEPTEQTASSPRRMSPERSSSPTKGLGGFVQSAMLKRSDSVSKRWGPPPGLALNRGNSTPSNENNFNTSTQSETSSTPTSARLGRADSPYIAYRPGSRDTEAVQTTKENSRPGTPSMSGSRPSTRDENMSTQFASLRMRSSSTVDCDDQSTISDSHAPTSPSMSRTLDAKRFSPTKTSWLESALNRPDTLTPKHKKQASQPSPSPWSKDRQARGSVDSGRRGSFKDVTPVGLMRSPAPGSHYKKPSFSGTPDVPGSMPGSPDLTRSKETGPESAKETPRESTTETRPESAKETPRESTTETRPDSRSSDNAPFSPRSSANLSTPAKTKRFYQDPESDPQVQDARTNSNPSIPPKIYDSASMSREPAASSPKPQVDFRSNLRRRDTPKDNTPKGEQEAEFRSVFGKLKKTETSNYVAPDELKNNILRGKAALNVTGGPKKTQRVDEFKESILKQKETMKAGGGSLRRKTAGDMDAPEKPAVAVPEAIAKRQNMNKTNDARDTRTPDTMSSPSPQEPGTPVSSDRPRLSREETNHLKRSQTAPMEETKEEGSEEQTAPALPSDEKSEAGGRDSAVDKSDEGTVDTQPPKSIEEPAKPVRTLPAEPAPSDGHPPAKAPGQGKLAGRINPALAGILSRGPPAASDAPKKASQSAASAAEDTPGAPLIHKTKNRARGPKRRLPNNTPAGTAPTQTDDSASPIDARDSLVDKLAVDRGSPALPEVYTGTPVEHTPNVIVRSQCRDPEHDESSAPELNSKSDRDQEAHRAAESPRETRSRAVVPPRLSSSPSPSPERPRGLRKPNSTPSPSPLRTNYKENQAEAPKTFSQPAPRPAMSGPRHTPRGKSHPSPNAQAPSSAPSPDSTSTVSNPSKCWEIISNFFATCPDSSNRVDIDPQSILMSGRDDLKSKTLKRQIWEITGDGKRQDLPVNQEYILYEGSVYLCVHIFEAEGSTQSEVQLWIGDDALESAVGDAQTFARKVAKDHGCKPEVLKQGKETARFIQALGGILITRRGSDSRSSSSALYMLCGRRHLGQMVLDEVDLSRRNLCSGYPFVVSAPFGNLYLWNGKGSGAEEIGAARLIGMDLGLTGEIEEVNEGDEPESFFENFPDYQGAGDYVRADYWHLKSNLTHFRTRLFRIDHELGQRPFWMRRPGSDSVARPDDTAQEIVPFCYRDLTGKDIYLLDIFFEIYVIVGDQASHRHAEFASALVLAHEYGVLAASMQDRPFIPKSFVSIGGLPDFCRSVFRKWDRRSWQSPLRVLSLNAAIEAIRT